MICNKCNTENIQGASYCKECGNPLSATVKLTKEDNSDSMENPFENASNNDATAFTAVASSASTTQTENPYQKPQYTQAPPVYTQSQYTQPYQQQVPNYPPLPPQDESHMTTLDWILRYCIALIPVVGPIIYIVMLFVWALGDTPKKSLKTWAQAMLIMLGVSFALLFVIMIFGGITMADLASELPY